MVMWIVLDYVVVGKATPVGVCVGVIAGLVGITPAAGYVSFGSAALIGIIAGVVCFYAVALKNKLQWDDALDVWGVHGVGGFIGILLLGVFGSTAINPAGADGLLFGNTKFFLVQCGAVVFSSAWAFAFTLGMLWLIDRVVPVKVGKEDKAEGLDSALHGEIAYETGSL